MSGRVVEFAFYRKAKVTVWRKLPPPEWSIVQNGRWGPRWLHRLVWRIATNLGMIRHAREMEERVRVVHIDREARSALFEEMRSACIHGFNLYGFEPGAIKIVCGENEIDELRASAAFGPMMAFDLHGPWHKKVRDDPFAVMRIADVPVKVIPGLKGWAVLPAAA